MVITFTFGTICTIGFVTLFAASIVECIEIHKLMTDEEIADFFHTSRDKIPEYAVVPVRHNLYKRSSSQLRLEFNAFGKKVDAYLEPSDGVLAGKNTPVWLASTKPDGRVQYRRLRKDIVGIAVESFVSPSGLSSVVALRPGDGNVSFKGTIDDLTVIPLPARFREAARSRRETQSPESARTLLGTHHHVIIKSSSSTQENEELMHMERLIRESRLSNETNHSRSKRTSKDIVYPSILITTDFEPSNTSRNDSADETFSDDIIYQLAFWNAVDLRFRRIDNPKIRLRIVGIIIGLDRSATPYVNRYRKDQWIHIPQDFLAMDKYWSAMTRHSDFPVESYDIVATMTDNNMVYTERAGVETNILGLTFMGLCSQWIGKFFVTAIIRDKGGFSGVNTAAHEIGHVLGLGHDRKSGDECDESHNYIMSPGTKPRPNNIQWSPCSVRRLSDSLRKTDMNCLDEPVEFHPPGASVRRLLPGDIADTHKQCQGRGYTWACDTTPEICANMQCYHLSWKAFFNGWWFCQNAGPAAEGTICSPGHICLDGVCQCITEDCTRNKA